MTNFPRLLVLAVFALTLSAADSPKAPKRDLVNEWEVHQELKVTPGSEAEVKDFFPSFLDYQDLLLFHPTIGYYSSGRVNFAVDYSTFPSKLAPYFGHMVAEQILRMWDGMRRAGTLTAFDRFSIAEFGAGNGQLAESILDYIHQQAKDSNDDRWHEFALQAAYVCYDRSPALSQSQRDRNARFGTQFQAREGDATDPTATIPASSLKGVILSNELPDAFSAHKVVFSADGTVEAAYVAPSLSRATWNKLRQFASATVQQSILKDDRLIQTKFLPSVSPATIYLSQTSFVALLESLAKAPDYAGKVHSIQFQEIYVPVRLIPELASHLHDYARPYAYELAKDEKGVVVYINLGEGKLIQGAGQILKAGYVMTIDYGSNWDEIMVQDTFAHLRTFGPGNKEQNSDPYLWPTLNDITTDVNFSHMEAEGARVGLKPVYFGPQKALQSGTSVSLETLPAGRLSERDKKDFKSWVTDFLTGTDFKVFIQQKENTDAAYKYPDMNPEPLLINDEDLLPAKWDRQAAIQKVLRSP